MILHYFLKIFHFRRPIFCLALLIFGILILQSHGVYAAPEEAAAQSGITQEDGEKLIGYLNMFLKMAAALLGLITGFISIFLYPGWVNGTMFGLQDYLKIIWVLVSNVVYFIFAGILIAIAFMNIIGKGDGMWELKQAMPKFIVGVLIVPFSWFFVQFLLSLSAILTVGVLTLPYESFQNEELFGAALEESEVTNQMFCKDIIISITGNFDGVEGGVTDLTENQGAEFPENIKCKGEEGSKVSIKQIISGEGGGEGLDNNIFGIISVYTYGILRVQELDTVAALDLTTVKGIMDLIFKVIFDLLFVVVYLILMVALFLALMVRGVRLWVYMMLSPLFGLLYFLDKKDGISSGEGGSKFSIPEFVALAMVPVYASAALAFGLVFILVATEGIKEASSKDDLDTLQAGGFSISIIGAHADGTEEKSVIAKLIVELFGVAVLWIAVMAALGSSEVTKNVTAPIRDFGKSVGTLVAKSPTYMPLLPSSLGGSAAGLSSVGSSMQQSVESHYRGQGSASGERFGNMITGSSGTAASALRTATDPHRTGVEAGTASAITSTLGLLKNQSLEVMKDDRELRTQFTDDLERIFGENAAGDSALTAAHKSAIIGASTETALAEALSRAFREATPNVADSTRRQAIIDGFGRPDTMTPEGVRNIMAGAVPPPAAAGTPATPIAIDAQSVTNLTFDATTGSVANVDNLKTAIGSTNLTQANEATIRSQLTALTIDPNNPAITTPRYTTNQVDEIITALSLS